MAACLLNRGCPRHLAGLAGRLNSWSTRAVDAQETTGRPSGIEHRRELKLTGAVRKAPDIDSPGAIHRRLPVDLARAVHRLRARA